MTDHPYPAKRNKIGDEISYELSSISTTELNTLACEERAESPPAKSTSLDEPITDKDDFFTAKMKWVFHIHSNMNRLLAWRRSL